MGQNLYHYWWVPLLVVGCVLAGAWLRNDLFAIFRGIARKTKVIRSYWIFSILFIVLTVAVYWRILAVFDGSTLGYALDVAGVAAGLTFAIFVGYFAFQQVVESRFEKLYQQGNRAFRANPPSYLRAHQYYLEAHGISPRNFNVLAELLELNLARGNLTFFDDNIDKIDSLSIEVQEKVIACYLKAARQLLSQNQGAALEPLAACVTIVRDNSAVLRGAIWDFRDIEESPVYNELAIGGDSQTIFSNLMRYLKNELSPNEKLAFEANNYLLRNLQNDEPID